MNTKFKFLAVSVFLCLQTMAFVQAADTPVALHLFPQNQQTKEGAPVAWYLTAAGAEPLQYQWKLNGKEVSGAKSNTLRISSAKLADGGFYTCAIKNQFGIIETEPVSLTVQKDTNAFSTKQLKPAQILSSQLP